MRELPTSWAWTTIDEIASTSSGGTPSRTRLDYYGGSFPWVKSGELNDGLVSEVSETITEDGLKNSSAKIFPSGTLCIALYGATVGKVGILALDAATNQAVCGITPRAQIEAKYLFLFLPISALDSDWTESRRCSAKHQPTDRTLDGDSGLFSFRARPHR